MTPGAITVIPGGGLCNRMAMLDSALALGRVLPRPVHVVWKLGRALNCRFEDLFAPLPGVERVRHVRNNSFFGKLGLRWAQARADRRGALTVYREQIVSVATEPEALLERARAAPEVRLRGDGRVFAAGAPFQGFVPAPALAARIAAAAAPLAGAVGVHVRRTDNADAIRRSPLSAFVAAMRAEMERDPAVRFYLATDEPEVVRELRREFGERVLYAAPRSLARQDPRAIQDALVELWCLAACRSLLASPASSFSQTAWELRGIPYRQIDITSP